MASRLPSKQYHVRVMSHKERCPICCHERSVPIIAAELCRFHARQLRSEGPLGEILADTLDMLAIQQGIDEMREEGA
jgi:ribosomal protein S14